MERLPWGRVSSAEGEGVGAEAEARGAHGRGRKEHSMAAPAAGTSRGSWAPAWERPQRGAHRPPATLRPEDGTVQRRGFARQGQQAERAARG